MNLQPLKLLWEHAWWAKAQLLPHVLALRTEEYARDLGSRFGSVQGTLAHLVGTEEIWLARWCGSSPRALPAATDFPTPEVAARRWDAVEAGVRSLLGTLDAEGSGRLVTYRTTSGAEHRDPLWLLMLHVLHHSALYRGQLLALLRQLGLRERVATDLVEYWRALHR